MQHPPADNQHSLLRHNSNYHDAKSPTASAESLPFTVFTLKHGTPADCITAKPGGIISDLDDCGRLLTPSSVRRDPAPTEEKALPAECCQSINTSTQVLS
jgi:hypothetical protein